MNLSLIDTHCHLNYDYLPKTAEDLVLEASLEGVHTLITIGTDLASIEPIQAISDRFEAVFHTVGVHPHEAAALTETELTRLEQAAQHPKCCAIGEIGLDYYYQNAPIDLQLKSLEIQLDLAQRLALPIVIHSREGEADLLPQLEAFARKQPAGRSPGVIHCFTGTQAFGQKCLDLGFYISFSGILTFKNAEDVRSAARAFPLDRILVETDSPFLAPVPFRGKKAEPKMVKQTALKLAEIKGLNLEEVAHATTLNAQRAFPLLRGSESS
jgi:TatD DNase family protein